MSWEEIKKAHPVGQDMSYEVERLKDESVPFENNYASNKSHVSSQVSGKSITQLTQEGQQRLKAFKGMSKSEFKNLCVRIFHKNDPSRTGVIIAGDQFK